MSKLCDLVGLEGIKARIELRMAARRNDGRMFPHALITGLPGCVIGDTKIRIRKKSEEGKSKIHDIP